MTPNSLESTTMVYFANVTSNASCYNLTRYSAGSLTPVDLAHAVLLIFVLLFGLFGNVLLWITLVRLRPGPTAHFLLGNLALGDTISLLVIVPSDITSKFSMLPSAAVCKTSIFARNLSLGVSVFTLTALAIDRCMAITFPMSVHKSSRPGLLHKIALLVIWILAIGLATPYAVLAHIQYIPLTRSCQFLEICQSYPIENGHYFTVGMVMTKMCLYYVIPGILISAFYGVMAYTLFKSAQSIPASYSGDQSNSTAARSRKKLARVCIGLAVVFFVAWLPAQIVSLIYFLKARVGPFFIYVKLLANLLSTAYSASNPLTLCILSRQFRQVFCVCKKTASRPNYTANQQPGYSMQMRSVNNATSTRKLSNPFTNTPERHPMIIHHAINS